MDSTVPYLRTQTELLADIEALQRDTTNLRWTEAEIYRAINQTMLSWHDKVKLPRTYTISGGWVASDYEYDLPVYIRPPIFPELLRQIPHNDWGIGTGNTTRWQDVVGWDVTPNSTGGLTLRLYAPPRTIEGQIIWYAPNSRVPLTLPVTSGSTAADATTVLLSSVVDTDDTGYIKIGSEYMSYSGVTRGTATTTLLNVVRALNGSAAAVHSTGATVTWVVGVDDMRLYSQLYNQVRSFLNALPLTDGGTHETMRYEKLMSYYQSMADAFWQTYKPVRRTYGLSLNRRAFLR